MGMRADLARLGAIGLTAAGCGPSLTTVHEGTVRFEHCYRVDLEPRAPVSQRKACWQRWVGAYTLGQPRDRIEYALQQLRGLDTSEAPRPELALGAEHHPEERQFYLVVPAPTSVHSTPPPIATVVQAGDPAEGDEGPPSERAKTGEAKQPPAQSCATSCRSAWQSCDGGCEGKPSAQCTQCEAAYAKCMRDCFE
jgi:hypothetical protein